MVITRGHSENGGITGEAGMNTRHLLTAAALLGGFIFAYPLMAADVTAGDPAPDKVLVTDGHVSHTIGNLDNHVTNWGLIGSWYSNATTFSDAPSAQWPAGSGNERKHRACTAGIVVADNLVAIGQIHVMLRRARSPWPALHIP